MAGPKGAPPPTPSLRVPLKWAKSPRSSGVRSLSLGSEMGSKGGLAGRAEMGAGGWWKGIQIRYFPQIWGDVSYWSQIPQSCRLGLGGLGGVQGRHKESVGRPLPQDGPLGPKRREAPSPILRLRRRCHSGAGHASTAAGEAPSPQRA